MAWRVAKGLDTLLADINDFAPGRNKSSDGSIGDERHQASPSSDHNPFIKDGNMGVVRARDFTHDPAHGFDSYAFAKALAQSKDKRIRYIISNGKIWNPSVSNAWRNYTGSNPHDHHVHVSIEKAKSLYDNTAPWVWRDAYKAIKGNVPTSDPGDRPAQEVPFYLIIRQGSKDEGSVKKIQTKLGINVDGKFGPATLRAVKAFQLQRGLTADGVVGPDTWRALEGAAQMANVASAPASVFDRVMEYVLVDEGSELNMSSNEPGGASRYGVSIDALSKYLGRKATVQDLKAMSPATVAQIYRKLYADPIGFDKLPIGLNYAALDFGINSGIAHVDGKDNMVEVEDAVLEALKIKDPLKQINKLCDLRLAWMKTRADYSKYKNGWTARVDRVRNRSINLAGLSLENK